MRYVGESTDRSVGQLGLIGWLDDLCSKRSCRRQTTLVSGNPAIDGSSFVSYGFRGRLIGWCMPVDRSAFTSFELRLLGDCTDRSIGLLGLIGWLDDLYSKRSCRRRAILVLDDLAIDGSSLRKALRLRADLLSALRPNFVKFGLSLTDGF